MHRVNWWAIIVATIVYFIFGWLWYGVLFASAWLAAIGKTEPPLMAGGGSIAFPYLVTLVLSFFLAYGLARVLSWRENMNPLRGAFIGLSVGLLVFGTMTWMDYMYEMRGSALALINIGYVVIGMGIQGLVLGAWRPRPLSS